MYSKHQFYRGKYRFDDGVIKLPESCKWVTRGFVGYEGSAGIFLTEPVVGKEKVALILDDSENSFWPVMSFLTRWEAERLASELLDITGNPNPFVGFRIFIAAWKTLKRWLRK